MIENCMFQRTCKNKERGGCSVTCYPYVMLHGTNGDGGFWGCTGVPKAYKKCLIENLPIQQQNPKAYDRSIKYITNIDKFVEEKGLGLFLYSVPNVNNMLGTGTGKTTTACTILNEYVINAVKRHLTGEKELSNNPALFIKGSQFQNIYNSQFRGITEEQQKASDKFYKLKNRMKSINLLVIDDIAIRGVTEAFENELYEIIDSRATENLATIYTSNVTIQEIEKTLGQRIASRIEGMAMAWEFIGADNRKGGLW